MAPVNGRPSALSPERWYPLATSGFRLLKHLQTYGRCHRRRPKNHLVSFNDKAISSVDVRALVALDVVSRGDARPPGVVAGPQVTQPDRDYDWWRHLAAKTCTNKGNVPQRAMPTLYTYRTKNRKPNYFGIGTPTDCSPLGKTCRGWCAPPPPPFSFCRPVSRAFRQGDQ